MRQGSNFVEPEKGQLCKTSPMQSAKFALNTRQTLLERHSLFKVRAISSQHKFAPVEKC